jgi:hypothetical protein
MRRSWYSHSFKMGSRAPGLDYPLFKPSLSTSSSWFPRKPSEGLESENSGGAL